MTISHKQQLAASSRHLLRPLIKVLLRNGLAYGEFVDVVKSVYVEMAREDLSRSETRPSDARVAVITGMTRKEVKRQRELLAAGELVLNRSANRATRVLSGWFQDPAYADDEGNPRLLTVNAVGGFAELVARYSGDMPAATVLDELLRVGAVEKTTDGMVKLINRTYLPAAGNIEALRILGTATADLLNTLEHNLDPNSNSKPRLQRSVFSARLPARSVAVFQRVASHHVNHLIEVLDDWLSNYEIPSEQDEGDESLLRAGVGVYAFQDGEASSSKQQ